MTSKSALASLSCEDIGEFVAHANKLEKELVRPLSAGIKRELRKEASFATKVRNRFEEIGLVSKPTSRAAV